jgi:predicted RNase H-like HicB family nuclease
MILSGEEATAVEESIALTFVIEPEGDRFVATCPELDVASFGDSVEDAAAHLENAVLLYLDVIEEDGERERVFHERGLKTEGRLETHYGITIHVGSYATVRQVPVGSR